jgi:multiple sugar transport system ATP-binding protein
VATISFEHVTKVYADGTRAVSDVDLFVPDGKLLVLVGPSGCGKTTLLRMLAGLESITGGAIRIGDRVVNDVAPKNRDIAMVFQNYALYPHMTSYDNMAFSLKLRRERRERIDGNVRDAAQTLGLSDLLAKLPRHLSGGQRQRVAMGRAVVRAPQVFLMDEPLSNLDAKLRVQMRAEIGQMQKELGVTTIYVTHDQTEAMTLGDLVAVMRGGVVQQLDQPQALFERPANLFVAGFIGSPAMNLVEAELGRSDAGWHVAFAGTRLRVPDTVLGERPALARFEGRRLVVGIRPEDMEHASIDRGAPDDVCISAAVGLREALGREAYVHFTLDAPPVVTDDIRELAQDTDPAALASLDEQASARQSRFVARLDARTPAQEGSVVRLAVDVAELQFFDVESGQAIYDHAAPVRDSITATAG